jgi:hypothetical protein
MNCVPAGLAVVLRSIALRGVQILPSYDVDTDPWNAGERRCARREREAAQRAIEYSAG